VGTIEPFIEPVPAGTLSAQISKEYEESDSSRTPLHRAAAQEHPEQLRFLLDRGTAADSPDSMGITPIQLATYHGRLEAVRLLLEAGADPAQVDPSGRSLWDIARIQNHQGLATWLSNPR
jgi:ankyrin repeat protein